MDICQVAPKLNALRLITQRDADDVPITCTYAPSTPHFLYYVFLCCLFILIARMRLPTSYYPRASN